MSRPRWAVVGTVISVVLVLALLLPTLLASWAPVLRWTCQPQGTGAAYNIALPVELTNSPYGGSANGIGTIPEGYSGSPDPGLTVQLGSPSENGTPTGSFIYELMTAVPTQSTLQWGYGPSDRCSSSVALSYAYLGPTALGITLAPQNTSDQGQPHQLNFTEPYGNVPTAIFVNGFAAANEGAVSTCGQPARHETTASPGITVLAQFTLGGQNYSVTQFLPFLTTYTYSFPANFGTWQVDNLTAGASAWGGGLAFSYAPCSS